MEAGLIPADRWHRAALGLVLLSALAARLWYASDGLAPGHNYDEKYSFRNVSDVLDSGTLVPRRLFYLTLSYLPQTGLLAAVEAVGRATGSERLAVRFADGTFTPLAYYVARLFSCAYGMLSIWLTWCLGRRFLSGAGALAATALLAAAPRHIVSSTSFKPDALVVLLTLVAALHALAVVRRGRMRDYAAAGLVAGAGLAAKLTGFVVAFPLTILTLWDRFRERSAWLGLITAGLVSLAVFAALNPFPRQLEESLAIQRSDYEHRARVFASDRAMVAKKQLAFLAEEMTPLGLFAVAGGLVVLARRLRREPEGSLAPVRLVTGMLVAFSLVHAGLFTLFRPQNYLPILPFAALAAGAALDALGARLRWRRRADAALAAGTVLLLAVSLGAFLYHQLLPDTWSAAWPATLERLAPLALRQIAIDPRAVPLVRPRADGPVAGLEVVLGATPVPLTVSCGGAGTRGLCLEQSPDGAGAELADALVLPADAPLPLRLSGDWIAGAESLTFAPRAFALRGPALRVLLHPRKVLSTLDLTPQLGRAAENRVLSLGELGEGAIVALELTYPKGPRRTFRLVLGPSRETLELRPAGSNRKSRRLLSPRFRVPAGGSVRLVGEGGGSDAGVVLVAHRIDGRGR